MRNKLTYAKVSINNHCNLNCSYCFLNSQPKKDELTRRGWVEVFDKLYDMGVRNVDFFGKEPLFDGEVFNIINDCNGLGIVFDNISMITNGVNLYKYSEPIMKYINQLTITHNPSQIGGHNNNLLWDEIRSMALDGLDIQISVDLHRENINLLSVCIPIYQSMRVSSVYINPIMSYGSNSRLKDVEGVTKDELMSVIQSIPSMLKTSWGSKLPIYVRIPFEFPELTHYFKNEKVSGVTFITEPFCLCDGTSIYIDCDGMAYPCVDCCIRNKKGIDFLDTSCGELYHFITAHNGERLCLRDGE